MCRFDIAIDGHRLPAFFQFGYLRFGQYRLFKDEGSDGGFGRFLNAVSQIRFVAAGVNGRIDAAGFYR